MKIIAVLALAAITAAGFTGCATAPTIPPMTATQLANTAILLKGTVRSSLLLVVQKNGTNAQNYVCAAGEALNVVLGGTNYTPGLLEERLSSLPIKELKSPEAQLATSTILTAYELYYSDYVANQLNDQHVAYVLLSAVRDGVVGACSMAQGGPPNP